mgnify:CR=1 FL=1
MSNRLRFTVDALKAIEAPARGRRYYRDLEIPGLELCITNRGARVLFARCCFEGQLVRHRLGRWPALPIDKARKLAKRIVGEAAAGVDPRARRRALRQEVTLAEAFGRYREQHLVPYKKRPEAAAWVFERAFRHWRNRKLSSITVADVQELHRRLARVAYLRARKRAQDRARKAAGDDEAARRAAARAAAARIPPSRGQAWANRALRLLRAVLNKSRAWGLLEGANPAAGTTGFREVSRRRFLQPEELKPFFAAVTAEPCVNGRDYVLLSLLTGARKSNLLAMRWADLRLDVPDPTWTIPAPDAKSGEPIIVPLVPEAVALLKARQDGARQLRQAARAGDKEAARAAPFVFPSRRSTTGHMREPRYVWSRVLARAQLQDLRLHDLRRSLGSWQARQGASLPIIGKSLGHSSLASTAIYAQLHVDPVRESVTSAVSAMMVAGEQKQPAEVIPMPATRGAGK